MTKRVIRPAMLVAALWATVATAHAMSSFPLPQFNQGNLEGLAYREADGHFFVTQNAEAGASGWLAMVYELDGAGNLLRSVDLHDLDPGHVLVSTISAPKNGGDLIVMRYEDLAVGGPYAPRYFNLSPDFSKISSDALPDTLKNYDNDGGKSWAAQVTETEALAVHNWTNSIRTTSLLDGSTHSVDLSAYADTAIGCYDGYLERHTMCMTSVAPSWNGGYFVINEGGLEPESMVPTARLMEFSADGTLVHAMTLDYELFDYHPTAIDVDEAGQRIFISFNNHKVVTLEDADFRAGALTVPEPGTWALLCLGALLMPVAVRRARRQA
jgi:hypothetical protein